MQRLIRVSTAEEVPQHLRSTAVERLIGWHNGFKPIEETLENPEILIGMCMDNRNALRIPAKFAFILRSGGGNLRPSEFKVSFAIAVGGVRAVAIIVHNHCGMVGLSSRRQQFVDGLVDAGWERDAAEQHFVSYAPLFEIGNEIDFALVEARRLSARYPKVLVAPLLYNVEDNKLYALREE